MSLFQGTGAFFKSIAAVSFWLIIGHGEVSLAVIQGELDRDSTAIVAIKTDVGLCTGTIINSNVVLTARHCVADSLNRPSPGSIRCGETTFDETKSASEFQVTTSPHVNLPGAKFYDVEEIIVPDGDVWCSADIAILVLADSVPLSDAVPLVPRIHEFVLHDEPYSVIGFGGTHRSTQQSNEFIDSGRAGERRRRDGLSATCGYASCSIEEEELYRLHELEWLDNEGAHCNGDSGGPALDSLGRVIGIISRSSTDQQKSLRCEFGHTYTSIAGWSEWIMYQMTRLSIDRGQEIPLWARGYSTLPEYNFPVGETCEGGGDCLSGLCHEGVCIRSCSDEGPCPSGFQCQGGTFRQVCIPEAEGGEENNFEDSSAEDSGGCASANGTPLALLGIWWARRRRQRQHKS